MMMMILVLLSILFLEVMTSFVCLCLCEMMNDDFLKKKKNYQSRKKYKTLENDDIFFVSTELEILFVISL